MAPWYVTSLHLYYKILNTIVFSEFSQPNNMKWLPVVNEDYEKIAKNKWNVIRQNQI